MDTFSVANLDDDLIQEIRQFEQHIQNSTGQNVAIVAYEQESEINACRE